MIKMSSTFFEFKPIFWVNSGTIDDKKGAEIGKRLFHIKYNYKFKQALITKIDTVILKNNFLQILDGLNILKLSNRPKLFLIIRDNDYYSANL